MPRKAEVPLFFWGRDDRTGVRSLRCFETVTHGVRFEVAIGGRCEAITIPRDAREDLGIALLRPPEEPRSER